MSVLRKRLALVPVVFIAFLAGSISIAHSTVKPGMLQFAALDNGRTLVPHVLITAMTVLPGRVIYAGGIYTVPNNAPYANRPITLLGSVWLVSHDDGATWTQKISTTDPDAFPKSGIARWVNHSMLPIDFTPASISVDPHTPRVIYVAGCTDSAGSCALPYGGPMVVRSTDGGQTWQTSLSTSNIVQTPALRAAYQYSGAIPTQAYGVVVDQRNSKHLYAAVSGLGVLRSVDGGRAWTYLTQPQTNQTVRPSELRFDPANPNTLYELDRAGALYRTTDAGTHWTVRAPINVVVGGAASSLTFMGTTLYVTTAKGFYRSNDGGAHWRLAYPVPLPGSFAQSVRSVSGWVATFEPLKAGPIAGLYAKRDGDGWQPAADTTKRGRRYGGALDFIAMSTQLRTRLWEDRTTRIIYTAGPLGGLYRWQSSL